MSADKPAGRVIITYGRSLMALVIARSLAQRNIEVIGCDDVSMTVLGFSKHVRETFTVAPYDTQPEQFLVDLEAAILSYAPRDGIPYVLMPVFRETELIARNRQRFEPLIKVAAPSAASFDLVHPKDHFAALADKIKLPAPATRRPEDIAALGKLDLGFPVIVKPVDGVGGRGVSIATDAAQLAEQFAGHETESPPLVQDFVEGDDYCVAILAQDGALNAIMAYRNLTTFPRKAGAGALRETIDAAPFRAATEKLLAATNWNGVAEIDFRWSGKDSDTPQIIEINPRFWGGIFHSIETGVDFPWLLYRQTIGKSVTEPEPEIGARTKSPGVWLFATLEDVAASDPHLNAAAEAWRAAKLNLATGKLATAMEQAVSALGAAASASDAYDALNEALAQARGAPTELSSDKDPLVGLGALFVLSHLLRHGKMPAELTYKANEPTPPPTRKARKRPVIGITKPQHGDTLSWWAMNLAVLIAGGDPVKLTAGAPRDPHTIDGLIFGGGSDVYPKTYAGKPKAGYRYDLARDDMEASWALTARRLNLPVLGVCRGMQMLNVLAGGTLYEDLSSFADVVSTRNAIERFFKRKPIALFPGSQIRTLMDAKVTYVNSIHGQSVDRVGAGLTVTAREPNGIIQALEDKLRPFWIGVQFHPELLIYRHSFRALFSALVASARARRAEGEVVLDVRAAIPSDGAVAPTPATPSVAGLF